MFWSHELATCLALLHNKKKNVFCNLQLLMCNCVWSHWVRAALEDRDNMRWESWTIEGEEGEEDDGCRVIRWPSWLRSNAEAAVPNGGREREALAVVLLQLCVSLANRFPFVLFAYAPPQSVAERATLKQMCCRCRTPQRSSGLISTMQSLKKKEKKTQTNKQKKPKRAS